MNGTIAITMAGAGRRFVEAGYDRPKYEIMVAGRSLFDWSMAAVQAFVDAGYGASFATRSGCGADDFVRTRCAQLGIDVGAVVELDQLTDGQATTARILAERAAPDLPFVIFNIDTFVAPGAMRPDQIPSDVQGWIPCFPGPGEGWSFARVDATGRVCELREKERISPHATVGLYWFASAGLYLRTYDRFFAEGRGLEKGERYVAPMYNLLVSDGDVVTMASLPLDAVGMLGTPEQVTSFRDMPPPAAKALIRNWAIG